MEKTTLYQTWKEATLTKVLSEIAGEAHGELTAAEYARLTLEEVHLLDVTMGHRAEGSTMPPLELEGMSLADEAKLPLEQQCRAVRSALVKAVDDSRQFTWEEIEQLAKPELVGDGEWAPAFIELEISAETLIAARSAPLLQVTIGERSAELPVTSIDRAPEGAERRVDFEDHGAHKESA